MATAGWEQRYLPVPALARSHLPLRPARSLRLLRTLQTSARALQSECAPTHRGRGTAQDVASFRSTVCSLYRVAGGCGLEHTINSH
eukprot:890928-Prymnesium_polylepis.1